MVQCYPASLDHWRVSINYDHLLVTDDVLATGVLPHIGQCLGFHSRSIEIDPGFDDQGALNCPITHFSTASRFPNAHCFGQS